LRRHNWWRVHGELFLILSLLTKCSIGHRNIPSILRVFGLQRGSAAAEAAARRDPYADPRSLLLGTATRFLNEAAFVAGPEIEISADSPNLSLSTIDHLWNSRVDC
jgi:hypothetical protein